MSQPLRTILAVATVSLTLSISTPAIAFPPTAKTAQGTAQGQPAADGKTIAFLGLPYAAPPIGDLRFRPPAPPAAWKGLRDATQFAHRCEQWQVWADYIFRDPGPSEDCLYLNVYVPATANPTSKLPVMFWIHGGGYIAGSGSEPRYDGSALAGKGVVLVTINYRLGVFGFLASDDLAKEGNGHAGNYALMDMVAALRWVRANIKAFGGDPANVTIFGESAGSFAVSTLLAAPDARGLFHKAIGESGGAFSDSLHTATLAVRSKRDQQWVESLGAKSLADLRAMPADKILDAAKKSTVGGFGPVIDGEFLPEAIPDIYAAGHQAHVPTIIGWNRDERTNTLSKDMTAEKWKAYANEHYQADAAGFLAAFPGNTDAEAIQSADAYTTAAFIALGTWRWLEAQVHTGGAPVYRYRFDFPPPPSTVHPESNRVWHSDELEYVFGTLDSRGGATWRPEDRTLSEQVMSYWTNFARTADPNGSGLPLWPRFDVEHRLIHLDSPISVTPDTAKPQFDFMLNHPTPPR